MCGVSRVESDFQQGLLLQLESRLALESQQHYSMDCYECWCDNPVASANDTTVHTMTKFKRVWSS